MYRHSDKKQKHKNQSAAPEISPKHGAEESGLQVGGNQPLAAQMQKVQAIADHSPQVRYSGFLQQLADHSPRLKQRPQVIDNRALQRQPLGEKAPDADLPNPLRAERANRPDPLVAEEKTLLNSSLPPRQRRVRPALPSRVSLDNASASKESGITAKHTGAAGREKYSRRRVRLNRSTVQATIQTTRGKKTAKGKTQETAKEKFDRQMKEMNTLIEEVNQKIQDVYKIKATLGTDTSTTPMNPSVFFKELPTTGNLDISKDQARLANFSAMVKEFVNAQQKGNVTPEIQTALVKSSLDAAETIHISGNTAKANKKMGVGKATTFGDYYQANIRPISIKRRVLGMETSAKKLISKKGGRVIVNAGFMKRIKLEVGDDEPKIAKKIARQLLKEGKRNEYRRTATSSRKFARAHAKKRVRVPVNKENIHAESAILNSLRDTKDKIQEIGGTKVACLACQAYFTHLDQQGLLGDNTGYAWISKSSQAQLKLLIDSINSAEDYLANLAKILESRLSKLKRYTGHAGDKKVEDMEVESDVEKTDSEDEEALPEVEKSDPVIEIAKALYAISTNPNS